LIFRFLAVALGALCDARTNPHPTMRFRRA
jgi:hypothetical protein